MAKSRFAHLFTDEEPAPKPVPAGEAKYEGRKRIEMLGHDRMLFEGLLLRYGKRWILAELARCLKNFPSYRKDD